MRIVQEYRGGTTLFDLDKIQILIGRSGRGQDPDIDLGADLTVSRRHARITVAGGRVWIEDLNSRWGTRVNGREVKGLGRTALDQGDTVHLGESVLRIEPTVVVGDASAPATVGANEKGGSIVRVLSSNSGASPSSDPSFATRRLALLYALPLELGAAKRLDRLFDAIVKRLIEVIPGAQRSALLIRDRTSGQLLLKAHEPSGTPAVSLTLARRAMESREAFVWSRTTDRAMSQDALGMLSAMYAPMIWNDEPLGVVSVDRFEAGASFDDDDLRLILAVARYAAMAVAHRQLHDELTRNTTLLTRLLTNFSPRVRDRLLANAQHGRFRLGGEKAEVTILCSDIRGFTRMSAQMGAEDVVDLLNDYFSVLVETLFSCDGSIDKFVGDSVLAVFGSPEPDPQQHEKAVRAAVRMQAAIKALSERRRARGLVTCEMGIGVHCGEVLHGFIGTAERMEFTVIGDAVNLAARYCDGAKATEVLISQAMHQRVWRIVDVEAVAIPTKHEGDLPGFRVNGIK